MSIIRFVMLAIGSIAIAAAPHAAAAPTAPVPPSHSQPTTPAGAEGTPSSSPPPVYPREELAAGIGGTVVLMVTIDKSGRPVDTRIDSTSGNIHLDEAAIKAVNGWRFHPATQNDMALTAVIRVPITFDSGLPSIHHAKGHSAGQTTRDSRPLGFYVFSDKNVYRIHDRIRFRLLLKNESSEDFWVYNTLDFGMSASFYIWAKDAKTGKYMAGRFIQDALTPPPTSKAMFTLLSRDNLFGVDQTMKIEELNIIKPGDYIVEVEYHSPIPKEFGFGLPIWSKEMGSVKASPMFIRIVP